MSPDINPFLVPGPVHDPGQPLCPWEQGLAEHADYYVDIDHTLASYEMFQREMTDGAAGLATNGRLVVVTGQEGCGKTSMINRCVHWLRCHLGSSGVEGRVIDLSGLPLENESVPDRMTHVGESFADLVVLEDVFQAQRPAIDILERRSEWRSVYQIASRLLDSKFVLLVLLPPIVLIEPTPDLVKEITNYAGLTQKRIVFFAEVTVSGDDIDVGPTLERIAPPIKLRVTTLKGEDGVLFGLDRLDRHRGLGDYPQMTEDTLRQALPPSWSIRYLQKVLYGVYELRRTANDARYSRDHEIDYAEIADYAYRHLLGRGAW